MTTPTIEPYASTQYTCKQSKYGDVAPSLPLHGMILSPSGGGKTTLLTNLILDMYRDCFKRMYIWSASITIDDTWQPVKTYIQKRI